MPGNRVKRRADFMRHGGHQLSDRRQSFRPIQLILRLHQLRIGLEQTLRFIGQRCSRRLLSRLPLFPTHAEIRDQQQDTDDDASIDQRRLESPGLGGLEQT